MAELAAGLATDPASELPPPARALAGGTCFAQHVQQGTAHGQAADVPGQTGPHAGRGCSRTAWNGPQFGLTALLYLAGQSLPVGGFAWSQGLAAAVERGHADTTDGVRRWLTDNGLDKEWQRPGFEFSPEPPGSSAITVTVESLAPILPAMALRTSFVWCGNRQPR